MRKIGAVVAEYNPFHRGHAYQLEQLRKAGATHIAVVMSGNFVQRGEPALLDKWTRAQAALAGGADLILELPLPYAAATAERFAFGAISLLESLGCVQWLGFGCESGDLEALQQMAKAVDHPQVNACLRERMEKGEPFAQARQRAVQEYLGESASLLERPNDILAVEYLRQLNRMGSSIQPVAVQRVGSGHDSRQTEEGFASASYLRSRWEEGLEKLSDNLPPCALPAYEKAWQDGRILEYSRWQWMELSGLRLRTLQEISQGADLSEGLENRIYQAVRQGGSLEEVYALAKSKRYSHARIRRICLSAFLGIEGDLCRMTPPYLRILGFNSRGREILREAGKQAKLPISHSLAQLERLGGQAARFAGLEAKAGDQYALALRIPRPCGWEYTQNAVILGKPWESKS